MEIDHSHGVRNANYPPFDVVHAFLFRELREVKRLASGDDELHCFVGNGAHLVTKAEFVGSVRVSPHLELAFTIALCIVNDIASRVEDLHIDIHMRSLGHCICSLNLRTVMNLLKEAFLLSRDAFSTMSGSEWVIGYAVEAGSPSSGTWRDTRIGGLPKWPPGPHPEVKKCPQCNRERVMLLQAFAPHAAHAERLLLIFVCNSA
eukprot:IDg16616t1